MKKRLIALLLCLALGMSLTACRSGGNSGQTSPSPDTGSGDTSTQTTPPVDPTPDAAPSQGATTPDTDKPTVNFAVLSGPTGVGAAKLIADAQADSFADVKYNVTVAADNSEISAKLLNDELDIACMASNVAANLYNKSNGKVTALCLSTLGVLYILESGETGFTATIDSMGDLRGQTIYATGQGANPEYVLDYLLSANGVDPDNDVEIIWKTAAEVQTALLTGEAKFAMLPVPAATAALVQSKKAENHDVLSVLDLTEEWNKVSDDSVLTMTTVVARTEFVQKNPDVVELFLQQYAASIEYVTGNVDDAAKLVVEAGIVPAEPIAKLAIPDCNLVYVAGEQMRDQIQGYYQVLFMADPASIGGGIPDDAFYYGT